MHILTLCLILTLAIVYVYDYTGFVQQSANQLAEFITKGKIKHVTLRKPWGCSMCITQWSTLIVLLFYAPSLCYWSFIFSWSTQHVIKLYYMIDLVINKLLTLIEKMIK